MTDTVDEIKSELEHNSSDIRNFVNNVDSMNDKMVLNMESELLLNKFICPNGHPLFVKTCSCHEVDIHQKNIMLTCDSECEYNNFRSLDCGKQDCSIYYR